VLDTNERSCIQNAINGVNAACTDTVDAWLYVQQGNLQNDIYRTLGEYDLIPKIIFSAMNVNKHSGNTMNITVLILQTISQDYETWRIMREQSNSLLEDSKNFWNTWRNINLTPYYTSMAGGGSRVSIGPILENFLSLKASRNGGSSEELIEIEYELMNHIGDTLEDKIRVLSDIVTLQDSPYCTALLDNLKKRISQKVSLEKYNDTLVKDMNMQLVAAIETRNPVALKACLYPGWYSVKYNSTDLYKKGLALLSELS
jgi:hypothetical protein